MVREILDPEEKQAVAEGILTALPDWFGLPESTRSYIMGCREIPFFAAFEEDGPVGFVALKQTGTKTGEIYVMGVLPRCHRRGLGSALYAKLESHARSMGFSYLQVKTVQMGRYEIYDRTNRFYQAMGFSDLECFPQLWEEANPCQIYVKYIGK